MQRKLDLASVNRTEDSSDGYRVETGVKVLGLR